MGGVSGQMGLGATPSLGSSPEGTVPPTSSAGSLDGWWDPCLLARAPQGVPASHSSQQTAALSYLGPLLSVLIAPDRPLLALSLSLERPPHPHISGSPPKTQQETVCVCFYFEGGSTDLSPHYRRGQKHGYKNWKMRWHCLNIV